MSEAITSILPLVLPLSVGGIGGFTIGYVVKKVYRPAIIVGSFIFLLLSLAYADIINLNVSELEAFSAIMTTHGPALIALITSSLLLMGGFAIGLMLGIKKG